MKYKKHVFALLSVILSAGILFGCNGADDEEPDPTEEPSEQQQQNNE